MSVKIGNFLGKELIIPNDRQYDAAEGLWLKELEEGRVAVGITEAALLMAGTVRDLEDLVEDGKRVEAGETVLLALTGRLKYLASPLSGVFRLVSRSAESVEHLLTHPYETALFMIEPEGMDSGNLTDAVGYGESLRDTEGSRNPEGRKGGVSPTCKAVYMGLGAMKLS